MAKCRNTTPLERSIYEEICRYNGIKAKELSQILKVDRKTINRCLYGSPIIHELCFQDREYLWHGLIQQARPHFGLEEFCGYYSTIDEFLSLSEEEWFSRLLEGCDRIGRSLNDTRGLYHSFSDCYSVIINLFSDLEEILKPDWEIAFEVRIKKAQSIRIFADVLIITENRVFSLEFKMKDSIDPEEVQQSAKYSEYLEIIFGQNYDVIAALVLTRSLDLYTYAPLKNTDAEIPVCSGDMLFNLFDEYISFLKK